MNIFRILYIGVWDPGPSSTAWHLLKPIGNNPVDRIKASMKTAAATSNSSGASGGGNAFTGKEKPVLVRQSNIHSAKAVADVVRTSLGPRGMDKMIRTANGETIVTNDGATILKHMAVLHPCARMLVELSAAQDVQAGDGTTSVVIFAGSLLAAAERLLVRGVHPSTLSEAFRNASQSAVSILEEISTPLKSLDDKSSLVQLAATSLSSKVVAPYSSQISSIAVEAVLRVREEMVSSESHGYNSSDLKMQLDADLRNIRVIERCGGTIEDTALFEGLLLKQNRFATEGFGGRIEKAKIAIAQFHLSAPKTDMEGTIVVGDYQQMDRVLEEERAYLLNLCKKIKRSGCTMLLVQKSILRDAVSDLALAFLSKLKIAVVEGIERDEIDFISRTLGVRPIADVEALTDPNLAYAELVEEVHCDGASSYIRLSGIRNMGRTASIIVRGATPVVLQEASRAIHDALCVVRCLVRKRAYLIGGGAVEAELCVRLQRLALALPSGAQSLAHEAFSEALLAIPAILAENAGLDPVTIVTELRNWHARGVVGAGISMKRGLVADLTGEGVVQPLLVSTSAIELATETVCMILKIDDIVAAR